MAKVSGITTSVSVDAHDISNDFQTVSVEGSAGTLDVTGLDKSAVEKIVLRADGKMTLSGTLNTASNHEHTLLSVPGSHAFIIGFPGATATFTGIATNYKLSVDAKGAAAVSVDVELSSGTAIAWS